MKYAIIGAGNMTRAFLKNIRKDDDEYCFFTPSINSAKLLADELDATFTDDINTLSDCDVLFLGFKPQNLNQFACDYSSLFKNKIIISILAGTLINKISSLLDSDNVIRVMPNLHSEFGSGFNLVSFHDKVDSTFKAKFLSNIKDTGFIYSCSEDQLDSLTLFSGSAPAFIYDFCNTLAKSTVDMNPDFINHRELLVYLLRGCAETIDNCSSTMDSLIDNVASKGGVTQQALNEISDNRVDQIYHNSFKRAQEKIDEFRKS